MAKKRGRRAGYTAVGFVVTKFGVPLLKRQLRKKVRDNRDRVAETTRSGRGRAGIALGAVIGAAAYLATRARRTDR